MHCGRSGIGYTESRVILPKHGVRLSIGGYLGAAFHVLSLYAIALKRPFIPQHQRSVESEYYGYLKEVSGKSSVSTVRLLDGAYLRQLQMGCVYRNVGRSM